MYMHDVKRKCKTKDPVVVIKTSNLHHSQ